MKKNLFVLCTLILCILCFSCSNLYQDFTTTTVELTPEFIKMSRNTAADNPSLFIYVCLQCENKTQIKTVDIAEIQEADGVTLQFDKLPVGKTGTLYVSVGSKKAKSELETYYSENIAELDGKTQFRVQPNGNTKIKVSLKENEERFFAQFLTFPYNEESPISNIKLNFTEYSTITAPLPVGTTRWQIKYDKDGDISYHGSFGEKIDVAKDLIQYKEYFINLETGENDTANFEATGNPMDQINTPVVYSSFDSTSSPNAPYRYNFANSLNEVGENTESLFNLSSEENTDYCFDNAGNLYFIYSGVAHKLAYDFDTNSYESVIIDDYWPFYNEEYTQSIAYDQAQNDLYLLGEKTNVPAGGEFVLVKFSNPAGTIYKESGYHESPESLSLAIEDAEPNSQSWTAHNGKIYVASVHQDENGSSYNLFLQEYKYVEDSSNNTWTWTSGEDKNYPINVNNTDLKFTTDIMYQDGSLYVIFRCYNTGWDTSSNYSTGGILKYDISSQTFDTNFGIKGFATKSSFASRYDDEEITINYFAPTLENETQVFYGPTKFVAIMPKKLVFLDQGANVEGKEKGSLSTKSRIVEYDLLTNTFSSKEFPGENLYFSYSYSE